MDVRATEATTRIDDPMTCVNGLPWRLARVALTGVLAVGAFSAATMAATALEVAFPEKAWGVEAGWRLSGTRWWYQCSDGSYPVDKWARIGKVWYRFDKAGYMLTGWQQVDGSWYYLRDNGAMATGWLKQDDGWYYLNKTGAMVTGWHKLSNKWYFFNESGVMATGWIQDGGEWYYCNDSGAMQTGWLSQGGARYYLLSSGKAARGFRYVNWDLYYFNPTSCAMVKKSQIINGSYYAFDAAGRVETTNWLLTGSKSMTLCSKKGATLFSVTIDGSGRFIPTTALTGWKKMDGSWFYFDPAQNNALAVGWKTIDGTDYHFNGEGRMSCNEGVLLENGTYWYMDSTGKHNKQLAVDKLMKTAKSLLGTPYTWGGSSPEEGLDCSGFVWYCYKQIGIEIGRDTYAQQEEGIEVSKPEAGDIVLMYFGAAPNYNPSLSEHAALYAGSGMIYEEPTYDEEAQYVTLASKWSDKYMYRRVLS